MSEITIDLTFIPAKTKGFFEKLAAYRFISNNTLMVGTALSIQIRHRLSKDLDFIFNAEKLNINTVKRNIAVICPD